MLHPVEERRQCRNGPVHLADNFSTSGFRDFATSLGCLARGLGRLSVMLLLLSDDLRIGQPALGVVLHVALPPSERQRTSSVTQALCAIEQDSVAALATSIDWGLRTPLRFATSRRSGAGR